LQKVVKEKKAMKKSRKAASRKVRRSGKRMQYLRRAGVG
jgi:hypothetical protein